MTSHFFLNVSIIGRSQTRLEGKNSSWCLGTSTCMRVVNNIVVVGHLSLSRASPFFTLTFMFLHAFAFALVGTFHFCLGVVYRHISFSTAKIGCLADVEDSKDADGLKCFYYLVQDLKCMVYSLLNMHFKIKPY